MRRRYEPWEDAVIRNHYPTGGVKGCLKLLPSNRTAYGVKCRAHRLHVSATDELISANRELARSKVVYSQKTVDQPESTKRVAVRSWDNKTSNYLPPAPRYSGVFGYAQGVTV